MKTRSGKEYHCETINNQLYRKGPAKLHVFGKGNYDTFKLNHLKSEDIKRMKLMFKDKIEQAKQDGWYDSDHYISYTELYEYVDERVRGDHDAWNVGINWKKEFADGGSVLQRPMFYQGGLTKTIPPEKGPMPQGLQSDVYDGIMRPGVINGRN